MPVALSVPYASSAVPPAMIKTQIRKLRGKAGKHRHEHSETPSSARTGVERRLHELFKYGHAQTCSDTHRHAQTRIDMLRPSQPPVPPHWSGFGTHPRMCCSERTGSLPVFTAYWLSMVSAAAKDLPGLRATTTTTLFCAWHTFFFCRRRHTHT